MCASRETRFSGPITLSFFFFHKEQPVPWRRKSILLLLLLLLTVVIGSFYLLVPPVSFSFLSLALCLPSGNFFKLQKEFGSLPGFESGALCLESW